MPLQIVVGVFLFQKLATSWLLLAKSDDKEVFEALSPALNDDFSDYSGHLSEGLNHHKLDTRSEIFQKLRDTYEAYEMDLLEQRKNR